MTICTDEMTMSTVPDWLLSELRQRTTSGVRVPDARSKVGPGASAISDMAEFDARTAVVDYVPTEARGSRSICDAWLSALVNERFRV